jgi:DNA polymerase/3'-5' exonuclease PolX
MSDQEAKTYPLQDAVPIAEKFLEFLTPHCHRIVVAGSIRRRKPFVKDIEILMVSRPSSQADPNDLFEHRVARPAVAIALDELLKLGVITKRLSKIGNESWGPENKLAIHTKSGMPVDFFLVPERNWWNALVVRTGPKNSNKSIAAEALRRGWQWHAYGDGFTRGENEKFVVRQERDAFDHVGLPYLPPEKR